jgi:hypothetical protein
MPKSEYTYAEANMIMCITRERECTPERCKHCGWLLDERVEFLKEHGDENVEQVITLDIITNLKAGKLPE